MMIPRLGPHHHREQLKRGPVHRALRPLDGDVVSQRLLRHLGAFGLGARHHLIEGEPPVHKKEHLPPVEMGNYMAVDMDK